MNDEGIEFKNLNDDYFDIIKYCLSRKLKVTPRIRNFVISHFDQKRSDIVEYIRDDKIWELKKYIRNNKIQLDTLNDEYFNLLTYCQDERNRFIISNKRIYHPEL
eukprot:jgi/Orpsp1_1/1187763/evm.model.d7180000059975.1